MRIFAPEKKRPQGHDIVSLELQENIGFQASNLCGVTEEKSYPGKETAPFYIRHLNVCKAGECRVSRIDLAGDRATRQPDLSIGKIGPQRTY